MDLEAKRTINLNNVSKKTIELISIKLGVSAEKANSEEWKDIQEGMLMDLLNSDDKAFEDAVAENFSSQVYADLIEKIYRDAKNELDAE